VRVVVPPVTAPTTPPAIYNIQPYNANGALSLDATGTSNGSAVEQDTTDSTLAEQGFELIDAGHGASTIVLAGTPTKCVEEPSGRTGNGTSLDVADCTNATNQQFYFIPDMQSGVYYLENVASGRCIDEPSGSTSAGVAFQVWDCGTGNVNQKFFVQVAGSGTSGAGGAGDTSGAGGSGAAGGAGGAGGSSGAGGSGGGTTGGAGGSGSWSGVNRRWR
jgi:hypothetical protein